VRGSRWEERFDLRSIVPRAHRPKGRRALVRVRRDDEQRTVVGIQRGGNACERRTLALRQAAGGLAPEPFPQSLSPQESITNTQCPGYRTAQPSDSPPWASRYASRAGTGRVPGGERGPLRAHRGPRLAAIQSRSAAAEPACGGKAAAPRVDQRRRQPAQRVRPNAPSSQKSVVSSECSLRRSLQDSGRSAPSRAASISQFTPITWRLSPLTARFAGRSVESVAERTRARSSLSALTVQTLCLLVRCAITLGEIMTGYRPRARRRIATACGTIRGGFAAGAVMRRAPVSSTCRSPTCPSR